MICPDRLGTNIGKSTQKRGRPKKRATISHCVANETRLFTKTGSGQTVRKEIPRYKRAFVSHTRAGESGESAWEGPTLRWADLPQELQNWRGRMAPSRCESCPFSGTFGFKTLILSRQARDKQKGIDDKGEDGFVGRLLRRHPLRQAGPSKL